MDFWRFEKDLKSNDYWIFTTTDTIPLSSVECQDKGNEHHQFNCKRCGAPNQIDVCEYCGSAYEGE